MAIDLKEDALAEVMEEEAEEAHRYMGLKVSIGVVLAMIIAGALWWLLQGQWVTLQMPNASMYPTIHKGEFLLVNHNKKYEYKVSDVVVMITPKTNEKTIKRIMALQDQTVEWGNDKLMVDGGEITQIEPENVATEETADYKPGMGRGPKKIVVPKGKVFVMGDNWRISFDSFDYGPIDLKDLRGVARKVFWPLGDRREIR